MLLEEKKAYVLRLLSQKHYATVSEISKGLRISAVSVRKLLAEMEKDGSLRRIWGGAMSIDPPLRLDDPPEPAAPAQPVLQSVHEAEAIAREAYAQIQDGETIFLGGGCSVLTHLAALCVNGNKRKLLICTNTVPIAFKLLQAQDIRLNCIGGEICYLDNCHCAVGKQARQMIEELTFDKCFLSNGNFTVKRGFSVENILVAEVMRAVIASSEVCYFLADYSAFGKDALSLIAPCGPGKRLITDARMPAEDKARLDALGMQVILAQVTNVNSIDIS